jgi:HK97 family phage portal protein
MDVLARIFGGSLYAGTPGPTDDFWYQPAAGTGTPAGMRVDSEGAQKLSAWFRGRDLLATALAMLPLSMYQRLPNDAGADRAQQHPLDDVLHRKPNGWQNSFQWRRQQMFHLIDHGAGYNWIVPGARGFAHELHPIHPTLVTAKQIASGPNKGRLLYDVRNPVTGQTTTHTQDEIFRLPGASDDGITCKGILEYARDNLGTAMAVESYAARIFSNGSLNGGIIKVPGVLDDDASKRMAQSFKTAMGDWHLPKVLEQGADWVKQDGMTPEKAQMLLSRQFSIDDIARWLGVPRQMLMNSDPSYGNAEQFRQDFVDFYLGPWLSLFEFAINDQLVLVPDRYYAEFTRDAIVRGNLAERWAAYQISVSTGTFTRNEVRRKENMKALPGLDEPLDPAHLTGTQAPSGQADTPHAPAKKPATADDTPDAARAFVTRAEAIAQESAARLLRKEIAAVQKAAVRHAADGDAFVQAVTDFYAKHALLVTESLQMPSADADTYCAGQAHQIVNGNWLEALELWQTSAYAAGLAAIALEETAA